MANLLPLDKAAAKVGKSEVTLRRLIKSNRVAFEKQKTLTGFIYLIDLDGLKKFYQERDGQIFEEEGINTNIPEADQDAAESVEDLEDDNYQPAEGFVLGHGPRPVRVAVASESGSAADYWQKKSELYEDRYNREVEKHSAVREELGMWRGRAEQAQSMLMKLLPAPAEVAQNQLSSQNIQKEGKSTELSWTSLVWVMGIFGLVLVSVMIYLYYRTSGAL